jgi:hypothetical protein
LIWGGPRAFFTPWHSLDPPSHISEAINCVLRTTLVTLDSVAAVDNKNEAEHVTSERETL